MTIFKHLLADTLHLFYPHNCQGCGSDILEQENLLCLHCISHLPHTHFSKHAFNPIEKIFWGRMPVIGAMSEFYFSKDSVIQRLIHQLKYKGNTDIGFLLGEFMGRSMLSGSRFGKVDGLIPLPLYPDKEKQRGYNQAAIICNGIGAAMNIPVLTGNVLRQRPTETQTKKHRSERWENVEGSFVIKNPSSLQGRTLLLVDDVITTGATLEACGQAILKHVNLQLGIAAVAHASK